MIDKLNQMEANFERNHPVFYHLLGAVTFFAMMALGTFFILVLG